MLLFFQHEAKVGGLPIAEAMAMELPVIVSNVSGPMAYLTSENSYIIPTLPHFRKDGYAEVNSTACSDLLKQVYNEHFQVWSTSDDCSCRCKGKSVKGTEARKTMQAITSELVVKQMASRIRTLVAERGWDV